jgi:hypothetical protein
MRSLFQFPTQIAKPAFCVFLLVLGVNAFPPAPHHLIYGQVRDEMGEPLSLTDAQVVLETTNGVVALTSVAHGFEPGVNYAIQVQMDSGITPDVYKSTALSPQVSFLLKVVISGTVYLPIEMQGNLSQLGEPAGQTRIDLTLGEDSDLDGLPDAWERALIQALGGGLTLADIDPNGDRDGDGLTNLEEYHAGTYAFDPSEGFALNLKSVTAGVSTVEFLAVRGRTYTVVVSGDLKNWDPVGFRLSSDEPTGSPRQSYIAQDFEMVELVVPEISGPESTRFFRAIVQ